MHGLLAQRVFAALKRHLAAVPSGGRSAADDIAPDFGHNLRDEPLTGRQWVGRAVVASCALNLGFIGVAFNFLPEVASEGFARLRGTGIWGPWLTLLWTPSLTPGQPWWTRRFAPAAAGSGKPQGIRALDDDLPASRRSGLVSLALVFHRGRW
ncbi:MAG: hypothetical protein C0505_11615 [Leptothrix sp. (in: Bacteria)]|nr:hypothetical protein [Leptothrix sp. (in: b-proteobacteria)]